LVNKKSLRKNSYWWRGFRESLSTVGKGSIRKHLAPGQKEELLNVEIGLGWNVAEKKEDTTTKGKDRSKERITQKAGAKKHVYGLKRKKSLGQKSLLKQ